MVDPTAGSAGRIADRPLASRIGHGRSRDRSDQHPARDRVGRRVHGGSSRPRRYGLRPKLRRLSCAERGGQSAARGRTILEEFCAKNVGDLLEFVSTYMPNGTPGSLSEPTYNDIVALMLKSNGFPAGATELGRTASASVRIVPKDGSAELPANALARVVGCLARSGADWVVTSATIPERAERVSPGGTTQAHKTRPGPSAAVRYNSSSC